MIEQLLLLQGGAKPVNPVLSRVWSQATPFGSAGLQYSAAVVNGNYYVFGGRVGLSTSARITTWRWNGTALTQMANLPIALVATTATTVNGKVYIIGGCYSLTNGQENKTVYVYDPVTNSYTTKGNAPFNTVIGTSCAVGTNIYVYGGLANQVESGFPKVFYKYDTLTDTWESLPYHDGPAVYTTTIMAFGTKLYVYGGEINNSGARDQVMRTFDTLTNTWAVIPAPTTIPGPRSIAACKVGEVGILIVGGRLPAGSTTNETWYYDIAENKWTKGNPMVINLAFNVVLSHEDSTYTFDGYNGEAVPPNGVYQFK